MLNDRFGIQKEQWDKSHNGKEVQKGGDICICMADSFCCTVETNTTL